MAIVQISKIQHRRGRKLSSTGMPQLSSGEIGWAIDTQQLYIGNGAVSEGAPYVGNTEILTEKTDIFGLVSTYEYKKDDPNITVITGPETATHVRRSLQERLDDNVSINAFISDEERISGDLTAAIQRAIDQLFLNDSRGVSTRVVLELEAGEYSISESIKIPPFANLRGAGKDKTIIVQTGNFPVFETIAGSSIPGTYVDLESTWSNLNQPRFVDIEGITFKHEVSGYPVGLLKSTRNSYFLNVKFEGAGYEGGNLTTNDIALLMSSANSDMVTCADNVFENCDFLNVSYGITSTHDINTNTFNNCLFTSLGIGVHFGSDVNGSSGKTYGPRNTKFNDCIFKEIDRQGILSIKGTGNSSLGCKFINVGNLRGQSINATYPVLSYGETGNTSAQDFFERSKDLTSNPLWITTEPYVSEFGGHISSDHRYNSMLGIVQVGSPTVLFRLGAFDNARYRVNYVYKSSVANIVRNGVLYVTVDKLNNTVQLSDEYDFSGDESKAENLKLTATLEDLNADTEYETIFIRHTNSTVNDQGTFNYWYDVLS